MSIKISNVSNLNKMQKNAIHKGDLQWELIQSNAWQCCLNCERFSTVKGVCTFNNNQVPPPQVIVLGCKDYTDDIPF